MPIVFTYDADGATIDGNDRNRIVLAFRRLGWEHIGGSAFRYPALNAELHASEDWFNHVLPALMFFRAVAEKRGVAVPRFTIEAHSSAGSGAAGADLKGAADIHYYEPTDQDTKTGSVLAPATARILSEDTLKAWIAAVADKAPGAG